MPLSRARKAKPKVKPPPKRAFPVPPHAQPDPMTDVFRRLEERNAFKFQMDEFMDQLFAPRKPKA
jgi:hypothetical protein